MGTTFRLVVYAPSPEAAAAAFEEAWQRLEELDRRLSDWREDSELNALHRLAPGPWREVSPDLHAVLLRSARLVRATGGAFDPTVGQATRLWRRSLRQKELPSPARLQEARERTGFDLLEVDPVQPRVRFLGPGLRLDFGAIGKGYALDELLEVLRRHGLERALLDGGGDLLAGAPPPGEPGWRVRVSALGPSGAEEDAGWLYLREAALATSGDTSRFVEIGGVRYSHIVDPATGLGLRRRVAASALAAVAADADAWASAACVLGVPRACEQAPAGVELRVTELGCGGPLHCTTPGFPALLPDPEPSRP